MLKARVRRTLGALLLVGALSLPGTASAWVPQVHRSIATLAYERLDPAAREQVAELLRHGEDQGTPACKVQSFEDAATWLDCTKAENQAPWSNLRHGEGSRYCDDVRPCKNGVCASAEINAAAAILRDRNATPVERLHALETVVHLVGDIHQPLHATNPYVQVSWKGKVTLLHKIWDGPIAKRSMAGDNGDNTAARELLVRNASIWTTGTVDEWVQESVRIAKDFAVPDVVGAGTCPSKKGPIYTLTKEYMQKGEPIALTRIALASFRLSNFLNNILG